MKSADQLRKEIRIAMAAADIRQEEISKDTGLSKSFVSLLMKGDRQFTPVAIDKISTALGAGIKLRRKLHKLGAQAQGWEV